MNAPRRVIVQPGKGDPCDLFVYGHIDPTVIKSKVAETTPAAVVVEFWGEGTVAYKAVLPTFGGTWKNYVGTVATKLGKTIGKTCLTTWSAGSQLAKDVCVAARHTASGVLSEAFLVGTPDAIVMLDGLYGAKPPGSKQGDGQVFHDEQIDALIEYAKAAARGDKIMVILHSKIPTPYASSKEVAEYIVQRVTELVGPIEDDPTVTAADFDSHGFDNACVLGNLHVIEFPGVDAKEHVTEAHLYDEVWNRWIPWVAGSSEPGPAPAPRVVSVHVRELALALSLAEEAAHVGETPPGSNKVKPAYWAGTTRLRNGQEQLTKVLVGPWCAASFQWASYEAARQLGLSLDVVADWTTGPVPHGRRISVAEVQHDMTQRGLFRSRANVLVDTYDPRPGDAVFMDRKSGAGQEFGHICRFVRRIDAGTFETVGGNEASDGTDRDDLADRWRRTVRRFDDPRLRGFGAFPDADTPVINAAPAELASSVYESLDQTMRDWLDRPRPELSELDDAVTVS